jgi:hypothetical protein
MRCDIGGAGALSWERAETGKRAEQAALEPVQVSATSQTPAEGRRTVLGREECVTPRARSAV